MYVSGCLYLNPISLQFPVDVEGDSDQPHHPHYYRDQNHYAAELNFTFRVYIKQVDNIHFDYNQSLITSSLRSVWPPEPSSELLPSSLLFKRRHRGPR